MDPFSRPLVLAVGAAWALVMLAGVAAMFWIPHLGNAPVLITTALAGTLTLVMAMRQCAETLGRVFVAGYRSRVEDERRHLRAVD